MANELSIDLRLALKKLRQDIREASKMIREGLNKTVNIGQSQEQGLHKTGTAMDRLQVKTKRVNQALADQLNVWKKLQNFRKPNIYIYGQTAMPKADYSQYGSTLNPTQGPMGQGGGLATRPPYTGGVPPMLPIPPIIPKSPGGGSLPPISAANNLLFWRRLITGTMAAGRGGGFGNVVGANQLFGAFSTPTGQGMLGRVGASGASGAAGATAAILVLVAAIKGLQIVLKESIASAERARQLYAKSISNGLGLQYNAQRNLIAQTMGVSENEIYQFGGALQFLYPRLRDAAKVSADSAAALTPLSYELRILKADINALFDTIAVDIVPVVRFLVNLFDEMAKSAQDLYKHLKPLIEAFVIAAGPAGAKPNKLVNDAGLLLNMFGPLSGVVTRALADTMRNLPMPGGFMKQMNVSSFERMGLVANMGSSGSLVDYSRRTAVATETIAKTLVTGARGGVPRTSLGFDSTVSNP